MYRMMEMLVNFGANVDLQSKDGSTALHLSGSMGLDENFSKLLELGASPSIANHAR